MPKIKYVNKRFRDATLEVIDNSNTILEEYEAQGFQLTLRQLFYQHVSRDWLPNTPASYTRLGGIVGDARLAGVIDWDLIIDRTRNLEHLGHWTSPAALIETYTEHYHMDKWRYQDFRPEVWIEKDALVGVIEGVCDELDVPYFACRGYTSLSEMWGASERLKSYADDDFTPVILHLGDHDPSGIDMTRDIQDRLATFGCHLSVERLALNMNQVNEYSPPPNSAKTTDSRFAGYIQEFGSESWELDALEPAVISELIRDAVLGLRTENKWQQAVDEENAGRAKLKKAAKAMRKKA